MSNLVYIGFTVYLTPLPMLSYITLLRPKDWAKNSFLLLPVFFGGKLFDVAGWATQLIGFFAFSMVASAIYIFNDYKDREDDKNHPIKKYRPLAAGKVVPTIALSLAIALLLGGCLLGYWADASLRTLFLLCLYGAINMGYTLGLKNIAILDIMIIAMGFSFRLKAGGYIASIPVSAWLNLMVFLLALFMAIAKRRDDIILKLQTGMDMRKVIKGYNVEFLNIALALFSGIIIMTYIMYCLSPFTIERMQTHHLYYTVVFVIAGLMRYLQITLVQNKAGSPTEILYKDKFIQITLLLWITAFYALLYWKDKSIF
jgi:decaprenyl-phosphate phosphoribosyltransferase